jgi:hypothetical protein
MLVRKVQLRLGFSGQGFVEVGPVVDGRDRSIEDRKREPLNTSLSP